MSSNLFSNVEEAKLRAEYQRLYGTSEALGIERLKLVIDEYQRRKLPLPGSERDTESSSADRKKSTYVFKSSKKEWLGTVLIADDNVRIAKLVGVQVQALGFKPVVVYNGFLALKHAEKELPRLAILDNMMPGLNGITLTSRLRALPGGKDIAILMITARGDKDTVRGAIMGGVNDFLCKPFEIKTLLAKIKKLVDYEKLVG